MLYASQTGTTTYVGAADDLVDLEKFYASALLPSASHLYTDASQPHFTDMMMDERFDTFRKPPYIFDHSDATQAKAFIDHFKIKIVPNWILTDKHNTMMDREVVDIYRDKSDKRTLAEIHGIDGDDPWDHRTPEEIEQAKEYEKRAREAKEKGGLSGDSFSNKSEKRKLQEVATVTDLRAHIDADGKLVIDSVLAAKGVYDDNNLTDEQYAEREAEREAQQNELRAAAENGEDFFHFSVTEDFFGILDQELQNNAIFSPYPILNKTAIEGWFVVRGRKNANKICGILDCNSKSYSVHTCEIDGTITGNFVRDDALAQQLDPTGIIAIYQRIDFENTNLGTVLNCLRAANINPDVMLPARGTYLNENQIPSCWVVCITQNMAEKIVAVTKASSEFTDVSIEHYAVNDLGERLLEKGAMATVVDSTSTGDDKPRPWNDRAAEILLMTDKEKADNWKTVKGKEFLFCGSYHGPQHGCVFYICPASYFRKNNKTWEEDIDITHLLPQGVKKIDTNMYSSRSYNWEILNGMLNQRGFTDSLLLQLYFNNL